jgi:hypothetical protein
MKEAGRISVKETGWRRPLNRELMPGLSSKSVFQALLNGRELEKENGTE